MARLSWIGLCKPCINLPFGDCACTLTMGYGKIQNKIMGQMGYRYFCSILLGAKSTKMIMNGDTVDGQNIQSLDNFTSHAPPNFKVVFFFQGFRRVDKRNQIPQHDMSRTRCLTLTFGDGGVMPIFSSGFEYFVHLRHTYKFNKSFSELNQRHS